MSASRVTVGGCLDVNSVSGVLRKTPMLSIVHVGTTTWYFSKYFDLAAESVLWYLQEDRFNNRYCRRNRFQKSSEGEHDEEDMYTFALAEVVGQMKSYESSNNTFEFQPEHKRSRVGWALYAVVITPRGNILLQTCDAKMTLPEVRHDFDPARNTKRAMDTLEISLKAQGFNSESMKKVTDPEAGPESAVYVLINVACEVSVLGYVRLTTEQCMEILTLDQKRMMIECGVHQQRHQRQQQQM